VRRVVFPVVSVALALVLAGCAARREATPTAAPAPEPPGTATDPAAPAPLPAPDSAAAPPLPGAVGAPWDTAARSRAVRRAHVYPRGESALGRKLVAALPDPGGLPPSEGGPAPSPLPSTWPPPGSSPPSSTPAPSPAPGNGCWHAQLLATADGARADRVRAEAAALLGVEVRVETRAGVHRVHAGGCMDADAALRLVERARGEGWPEAFRVRVGS
jgi:hypothetical protein